MHDAVGTLAGVWRQFGAALGLAPSALREIDEANRGMPAQCLFSTIDRWLRQDYNYERYGPSSWRRLVMAVECDTGGQNAALAKTIAKKHFIGKYHITHLTDEYHLIDEHHTTHLIEFHLINEYHSKYLIDEHCTHLIDEHHIIH